jgi:hypothetical protein
MQLLLKMLIPFHIAKGVAAGKIDQVESTSSSISRRPAASKDVFLGRIGMRQVATTKLRGKDDRS